MDMKKAVLTLFTLGFTSMASFAEQSVAAPAINSSENVDCNNFASLLTSEVTNQPANFTATLSQLLTACPTVADQIIETTISLTDATQHQELMQLAADTGLMQPADILLAAIAGGGDPATLSEPTAAGNLSIAPISPATVPPIIGGRNGGTGEDDTASNN